MTSVWVSEGERMLERVHEELKRVQDKKSKELHFKNKFAKLFLRTGKANI